MREFAEEIDSNSKGVQDAKFEEEVEKARALTPEERLSKLKNFPEYPSTCERKTITFNRNPNVVAEALERANGKCQHCKQNAPFNKNTDGKPFLEVHHIKPLSEGAKYPPITFSFGGGFHWKGFDFSINFQGNLGKYVHFNQAYEVEFPNGNYRVHASQLDYWTPTNPGANHSTLHFVGDADLPNIVWGGGSSYYDGYETKIEDRFWRKADYLRLKEVYLSYTYNALFLKKHQWVKRIFTNW